MNGEIKKIDVVHEPIRAGQQMNERFRPSIVLRRMMQGLHGLEIVAFLTVVIPGLTELLTVGRLNVKICHL